MKALFLVALLIPLSLAQKCGYTNDVDILLADPPKTFDISCLTDQILRNFFAGNAGRARVIKLLECFDPATRKCKNGYKRIFDDVNRNFSPGTLRCLNCTPKTNRIARKAARMFQEAHEDLYIDFLRLL